MMANLFLSRKFYHLIMGFVWIMMGQRCAVGKMRALGTFYRSKAFPSSAFSSNNSFDRATISRYQNFSTSASEKLPLHMPDDVKTVKIGEKEVFKGYRTILQKEYLLPSGRTAQFDVLHQTHLSVVVFVWDSQSASGTLVREYHPGPERHLYGTVAGMYEHSKHRSVLEAAQHELEEEARLQTTHWIPLLQATETQMPLDKYSNNNFLPFLALDGHPVSHPRPLDDEEFITIHPNVTYDEMMHLIRAGEMNVVSTFTVLLGVQKLLELGIPLRK